MTGVGAATLTHIDAGGHVIVATGNAQVQIGTGAPPLQTLHQLPPPTDLTGRDAELRDLLTLVESGGVGTCGARIVLHGMGGIGKTALAVVLAHRVKERWPDAQIFLNLRGADLERRPPLPPADAIKKIIHAFQPGMRLPETVEELHPIYFSILQEDNRRVLIVLDNVVGPEQIEPLLPPPNCLLLVTSRQRFRLPGVEWRPVDCLRPDQSAALLRRHAPGVEQYAESAADLCGHLPLALIVFAGAVNNKCLCPVPKLIDRLRAGQEKLTPVDAAFQVSYEMLSEKQRQNWFLLAVFRRSFDLRSAATIWGIAAVYDRPENNLTSDSLTKDTDESAARDAMQALVNANLVEWNIRTGRFHLHDLARQFCHAKCRGVMHAAYAEATCKVFKPLVSCPRSD